MRGTQVCGQHIPLPELYHFALPRDSCIPMSPVDTTFARGITGGQFFNVFNLGKSEAELKTLKTKELKNGESYARAWRWQPALGL